MGTKFIVLQNDTSSDGFLKDNADVLEMNKGLALRTLQSRFPDFDPDDAARLLVRIEKAQVQVRPYQRRGRLVTGYQQKRPESDRQLIVSLSKQTKLGRIRQAIQEVERKMAEERANANTPEWWAPICKDVAKRYQVPEAVLRRQVQWQEQYAKPQVKEETAKYIVKVPEKQSAKDYIKANISEPEVQKIALSLVQAQAKVKGKWNESGSRWSRFSTAQQDAAVTRLRTKLHKLNEKLHPEVGGDLRKQMELGIKLEEIIQQAGKLMEEQGRVGEETKRYGHGEHAICEKCGAEFNTDEMISRNNSGLCQECQDKEAMDRDAEGR